MVAGGNGLDRSLIISNLKSRGLEQYLVKGSDGDIDLKATCKKYDIGYQKNSLRTDKFYINGHWKDAW